MILSGSLYKSYVECDLRKFKKKSSYKNKTAEQKVTSKKDESI